MPREKANNFYAKIDDIIWRATESILALFTNPELKRVIAYALGIADKAAALGELNKLEKLMGKNTAYHLFDCVI
ncbi:hypothetical protein [Methylomonas sp. AM2-LC]|uniref:hypothetical protein n=1 Tax=Methylomonas sp. AM2-LC TaxID=3153301 RepID=UPI0032640A7B